MVQNKPNLWCTNEESHRYGNFMSIYPENGSSGRTTNYEAKSLLEWHKADYWMV